LAACLFANDKRFHCGDCGAAIVSHRSKGDMKANSAPAPGGGHLRGVLHAIEKEVAALTVACAHTAILALDRPAALHHLLRRVICVENPAVSTAGDKSCCQLIQCGT
jgi:hypothetical protein